jgi:hypothetical protein
MFDWPANKKTLVIDATQAEEAGTVNAATMNVMLNRFFIKEALLLVSVAKHRRVRLADHDSRNIRKKVRTANPIYCIALLSAAETLHKPR